MSAARDEYLAEVAEAVEGAHVEEDGGTGDGLPPITHALVREGEVPERPAEIIEGVLLETHKMLLTGPSKANKTWCLIALAVSVATGGRWVGFRCAQRTVLYVDLETDPRTLHRRILRVARAKGANADEVWANLFVWGLRGQSCGLSEIVGALLGRYRRGELGMVVIDPAYMVQDGDENNARDIRDFFAELDRLCVGLACTVVISHHHSKGAQGLKSAIDRGSGSGVFGRAPDAVVDLTQLVLDESTLELARQSNRLAEADSLTGWRMSFTLREFPPMRPVDVWFRFPLHERDDTGLLAECKPNFGGLSDARRARVEAENDGKVAALDAACERLVGAGSFAFREDVAAELGWTQTTVNRWLRQSSRFERGIDPRSGRATVLRREPDGDGDAGGGPGSDGGKGAQRGLPLKG